MSDKLCILFSGGLDSYIAYRQALVLGTKNIELLRVNLGQPYNIAETTAIRNLGLTEKVTTIELDLMKHMKKVDNVNIEIPGRNMLLVQIAWMMGARLVFLGAMKGEMSYRAKDKNETFFKLISGVGSFVFHDHQGEVEVTSPFLHMSKLEVVEYALGIGVTEEELTLTSSCLFPIHITPCGNCKVCIRRAGIFRQLGIAEKYAQDPFKSEVGLREIDKCKKGLYEPCRAAEILGAL